MIRIPVNLSRHLPIGRKMAADIASIAGHFHCTLTLERDGIVLNLKSMIGLLSQSVPVDGKMTLVANGPDEQEAVAAVIRGFAPVK